MTLIEVNIVSSYFSNSYAFKNHTGGELVRVPVMSARKISSRRRKCKSKSAFEAELQRFKIIKKNFCNE